MAVYVDDMAAAFGRMKMCHVIADSSSELLAMMDRIGVRRRWIQYPGTPREHFDIAMSKRKLAVAAGAVEVTLRQLGCMTMLRRTGEPMGSPDTAEERAYAKIMKRRLDRDTAEVIQTGQIRSRDASSSGG